MDKNVKSIKVEYEDGTEKIITSGMAFEVYEKGESVYVRPESIGSYEDEIAVLAIVSRLAKDVGIDEKLISGAEEVS